jgi:hypothetical protein
MLVGFKGEIYATGLLWSAGASQPLPLTESRLYPGNFARVGMTIANAVRSQPHALSQKAREQESRKELCLTESCTREKDAHEPKRCFNMAGPSLG